MNSYPLTVDDTVERFQTYQFILSSLFELNASRIASLEFIESKVTIGKIVYFDSKCIDIIKSRIFELRGDPDVLICPSVKIKEFLFEVRDANDTQFINVNYAFRTFLQNALDDHKFLTSSLWDEASVDAIESIKLILDKQLIEIDGLLSIKDKYDITSLLDRITSSIKGKEGHFSCSYPIGLSTPEPDLPTRDSRFVVMNSNDIQKPADSIDALRYSYHSVAICIEVVAVEIISRLIVDYPEMPYEFRKDLARQCYDECCHTKALIGFLEKQGGAIGQYPIHFNVWNYYQMGDSISERLAIQQIVQEGHALDFNVFQTALHRSRSEFLEGVLNDFAGADELNHVRYGVKWLNHLHKDEDEVLNVIDNVYEKLKKRQFTPKHKVRRGERKIAWMTDEQIDRAKKAVDEALELIKSN